MEHVQRRGGARPTHQGPGNIFRKPVRFGRDLADVPQITQPGTGPTYLLGDFNCSPGVTIPAGVGGSSVWGPPFGGRAHVDLDVCSFTIAFGAKAAPPPPVAWTAFRTNFLPPDSPPPPPPPSSPTATPSNASMPADTASPTNVVKAGVTGGLLATNSGGVDWIIDPETFELTMSSATSGTCRRARTKPATGTVSQFLGAVPRPPGADEGPSQAPRRSQRR